MIECKKCSETSDSYYIFRDRQFGEDKVRFCRECYEEFMYLKMRKSFIDSHLYQGLIPIAVDIENMVNIKGKK